MSESQLFEFVRSYPGNPIQIYKKGKDPHIWVYKHDVDLDADLRKERPNSDEQGAPETVPLFILNGRETLPFEEVQQLWWMNKLNRNLPKELFPYIIDIWTSGGDGASTKIRNGADHVNGLRLDLKDPNFQFTLDFGGNHFHVIGETEWPGGSSLPAGTDMLEIEALDFTNLPDVVDYSQSHLYHHITIVKGGNVNPANNGRITKVSCFKAVVKMPGSKLLVERRRAYKLETLTRPNQFIPTFAEWKSGVLS